MQNNPSRKKIDEILLANDNFKIVGVESGASKDEIKKAYYKASLLVHPDKTQEKGAAEAFIKLSNAYEDLREGRRTQNNPTKPKAPKKKKRTTEAGNFDEIFRNFFKQNAYKQSYEEREKSNKMILNWYYNQKK